MEAGPGYVVLGDNPAASTDSSEFGPVPGRLLRGRAVYRYAPADRRGAIPAPVAAAPASRHDVAPSPDGNIQATPVTQPAVAPADHHQE